MATNNNPDLLYQKSREQLLNYEDARLNSLIQAVADFYSTRNDQSIWGNFLRALANELARLDYDYSYDLVNKDPSLLTPPDIRRRWAAPLYVSGNWPSPQQFDFQYKLMLVELIAAYRMGTTVKAIEDVIFAYTGLQITVIEPYKQIGNGVYDQSDRNSIIVSVAVGNAGSNPLTTITSLTQLQTIVQSLYNAIALAKPAHVGLEFTTIFGSNEEALDCFLSPTYLTQQQFNELNGLPDEQAYYLFTGYVQVNPAIFWMPSAAFPLGNLLLDFNKNFQLVTNVGAFPNTTGLTVPVWSKTPTVTTADGNLTWLNISPGVVSTSVTGNVLTVDLSINVPLSSGTVVTLYNLLGFSAFLNGVPLTVKTITGNSFTASFVHANYAATVETQGTATFGFPASINMLQYSLLNATWQGLYQKQYTNMFCTCINEGLPDTVSCEAVGGINDTLRIFVRQQEFPPFGPMLIQAPVLNPFPIPGDAPEIQRLPPNPPLNPKTTVAAYGRLLAPSLSPAAWATLPKIFFNIVNGVSNGTVATYTYVPTSQFLHEGELVTITGFASTALNVTAQVRNVFNVVVTINGTAITSDVLTVSAPNQLVPGMLVTLNGTAEPFLNGQTVQVLTASPTGFTAAFTHADFSNPDDTGTGEVSTFQIPNTAVAALQAPSPIANAGLVSPTLQSGYYLSGGLYKLGQLAIITDVLNPGVGSNWVFSANVFQGQIITDSIGNTQIAIRAGVSGATTPVWNQTLQGSTTDGSVIWRNVGRNVFGAPSTWVGILNFNFDPPPFTGEVGNWDSTHQYGLVAPRLNQVWEISGGDFDQIFGLY